MTIREIRKAMRSLGSVTETLTIDGWGQIKKIGSRYAVGPLPERDDTDLMRDYDSWTYGMRESWILDDIKRTLKIA